MHLNSRISTKYLKDLLGSGASEICAKHRLSHADLMNAMAEPSTRKNKGKSKFREEFSFFSGSSEKESETRNSVAKAIITELGCIDLRATDKKGNYFDRFMCFHVPSCTFLAVSFNNGSSRIDIRVIPPILDNCCIDGDYNGQVRKYLDNWVKELKIGFDVTNGIGSLSYQTPPELDKDQAALVLFLATYTAELSLDIGYCQANGKGTLVLSRGLRTNVLAKAYAYLNSEAALSLGEITRNWWVENSYYFTANNSASDSAIQLLNEAKEITPYFVDMAVDFKRSYRKNPDVMFFAIGVEIMTKTHLTKETEHEYYRNAFEAVIKMTKVKHFLESLQEETEGFLNVEVVRRKGNEIAYTGSCLKKDVVRIASEIYTIMCMDPDEALAATNYKLEIVD